VPLLDFLSETPLRCLHLNIFSHRKIYCYGNIAASDGYASDGKLAFFVGGRTKVPAIGRNDYCGARQPLMRIFSATTPLTVCWYCSWANSPSGEKRNKNRYNLFI